MQMKLPYAFAPHSGQNFAPSASSAPQAGQMRFTGAAGLPHSGQNFAPEAIFAPQLGQNVPSATGAEAAGAAAADAGSGFFSFSSLIRLISASNRAMA